MATGGDKAFFTNVDESKVFSVQFNPKEFKLDESAAWKDSEEFNQDKPLLTFDKGAPSVVSMSLIFDTTDTGDDVGKKYVDSLRSFLCATHSEQTDDGETRDRPAYCRFTWKDFDFHCVVEKLGVEYIMFKADGTPLRAKVSVTLKERQLRSLQFAEHNKIQLTARGSMLQTKGTDKVRTYTVAPGDTSSSVAKKTGADEKDLMKANNIDDGTDLKPGDTLVVPPSKEVAEVMEAAAKSKVESSWGDDGASDAFGAPSDDSKDEMKKAKSTLDDGALGVDFVSGKK